MLPEPIAAFAFLLAISNCASHTCLCWWRVHLFCMLTPFVLAEEQRKHCDLVLADEFFFAQCSLTAELVMAHCKSSC